MKDLFYSHKEKILFWIAGYTADNNTSHVHTKISSLNDNARFFATSVDCDFGNVKTLTVSKSRRYLNTRVFYVSDYAKELPENTFVIGKDSDWTMNTWLND